MTNRLMQLPGVVTSLCVMTGVPPQLSFATTAASLTAGTALAQLTVTSAGMLVIPGAVMSFTVIVWVLVLKVPQACVAASVRAMTNRVMQLPGVVTSLCVMTGVPPQLSVATTAAS